MDHTVAGLDQVAEYGHRSESLPRLGSLAVNNPLYAMDHFIEKLDVFGALLSGDDDEFAVDLERDFMLSYGILSVLDRLLFRLW